MVDDDERRLVFAALVSLRQYGTASPELAVARSGLGRVAGYAALASLERRGLIVRESSEGLVVTFGPRRMVGL